MKTVLSVTLLLFCCATGSSQYTLRNASLITPEEPLLLWGEHNEIWVTNQKPGEVLMMSALHSEVNQSKEAQVVNGQIWLTPMTQEHTVDTIFLYKDGILIQKQAFRIDTSIRRMSLKWGDVTERGHTTMSIQDIDPARPFELYYPECLKKCEYFVTRSHIVVTDANGHTKLDTNLSRWGNDGYYLDIQNSWANDLKVGDTVTIDKVRVLCPYCAERTRRSAFKVVITE